jgi:peptide chain release factor
MNFPVEISQNFIDKALKLGINAQDFKEEFVRGSGKGGQKVNKTSSTVLLKHLPSGLEVRCQKHREQSKNRISAYKLLILKIEKSMLGKKSEMMKKIYKLKKQKQKRSKRAKEKLLELKKRRSVIKSNRRDIV